MTNQTIDELRELKTRLERTQQYYGADPCDDVYTLDKAIIACEQLRKYRKKAKRWKRKYLNLEANYDEDVRDAVEYNNKMWKFVQKGERMTTIEKIRRKLQDKIEIHVCEVEENTLIAQGMLKALGMMDEVLDDIEQEPCEDAKSTKEVMKILTMLMDEAGKDGKLILSDAKEMIADLPNVQPKPKTGHWIAIERGYLETPRFECSECHTQQFVETCMDKPIWNYCPNCGAKMVEPQESEE